jgi:hypothetical protein
LPSSVVSYIWSRFVVFQTCITEFDGTGPGGGSRYEPADIIVVELTEGS